MFTGLIEEMGMVAGLTDSGEGKLLTVNASAVLDGTKIGDSISINGACQSVTAMQPGSFTVFVSRVTLQVTTLGRFRIGQAVNLERALTLTARLGGHIVQGHVDQTAVCKNVTEAEGSWYYTFEYEYNEEMAKKGYMTVDKGSVTVNGVSLTVVEPTDNSFKVAIIPYTHEYTNFHQIKEGSVVNLEFDIIGKYISRLLTLK